MLLCSYGRAGKGKKYIRMAYSLSEMKVKICYCQITLLLRAERVGGACAGSFSC